MAPETVLNGVRVGGELERRGGLPLASLQREFLTPNWMARRLRPSNLGAWLNDDTRMEIFLGGKAAGFPFLHWDERHYLTFVFQVYGEKLFYAYPPEQTPFLYPTPGRDNVSLV